MDVVDQVAPDDLQYTFEEVEIHSVGNKLKEIWTMDTRQQLDILQKHKPTNDNICHSNIGCTRISITWMVTVWFY